VAGLVRRKVLQDIANTLCDMLVGWRMGEDLETLSDLPDGTLRFDLLNCQASHSVGRDLSLHVAGELSAWFEHRLREHGISRADILRAELVADFSTDRVKTNRKRIVSFDWKCSSRITTDEKVYEGQLKEKHQWHSRLPPNTSSGRVENKVPSSDAGPRAAQLNR
jgi:hypothetical protein